MDGTGKFYTTKQYSTEFPDYYSYGMTYGF